MNRAQRKTVAWLYAACLLGPATALAWGPDGHQTVGAIADQMIQGSAASGMVSQLLGGLTLREAAVWADCAKGVTSSDGSFFTYHADAQRYPECNVYDTPEWHQRFEDFASRNWKQCGTAHGHEYCHNQYHYTDVSNLRDHYEDGFVGTQPHDVVHAIEAATAVLRGQPAPPPFSIADKREALLLLSHYVGDIHQPLHVEAIYLDRNGQTVDPDRTGFSKANDTQGGNAIADGHESLHHEWDAIPAHLKADGSGFGDLVTTARATPLSAGDVATWPTQWATDTIESGHDAFTGLSFKAKAASGRSTTPAWTVTGIDAHYRSQADQLKAAQLSKAGARLAQVLLAVAGDASSAPSTGSATGMEPVADTPVSSSTAMGSPSSGSATGATAASSTATGTATGCEPASDRTITAYLAPADLPDISKWLPPAPSNDPNASDRDHIAQKADDDTIRLTRSLLDSPRGVQAAEDDVYDPPAVAQRFKDAIRASLDACNAPMLMRVIARAQKDSSALLAPYKRDIGHGGRKRPFVAQPSLQSCLYPVDMAGKRHDDIDIFHLDKSGSYPSGHALLGMFIGLMFNEVLPERGSNMLKWGLDFGDSRVVCGFHYPSDVMAGRLAASALWARLHADADFTNELAQARREVRKAVLGQP